LYVLLSPADPTFICFALKNEGERRWRRWRLLREGTRDGRSLTSERMRFFEALLVMFFGWIWGLGG
jgi:hypothetical protein